MGRPQRYIPENRDGVLVEVTVRTIGARALLVPAPNPRTFNEVVVGVIGRGLEVSPVGLSAIVVLANHLHLLLVVEEQQSLSRFMHHVDGNLSKEIGRIRGWKGSLWARPYAGIPISSEPEVQWKKLKYVLSHSVKEGLCESPREWPGVHCASALVHGEPLEGVWFNRTKECAARHCGQEYGTYDFATRYTRYRVGFEQLPAYRHLSAAEYQGKVAELIFEIEAEGKAARNGDSVMGRERILAQNPYKPPTRKTKNTPQPRFHGKDPDVRKDFMDGLRAFLAQYAEASEAYRGGNLEALGWFPPDCFPPALPFLGAPALPRPPSPPTRRITVLESGQVERGEVPVVTIEVRTWPSEPQAIGTVWDDPPRARGQPG